MYAKKQLANEFSWWLVQSWEDPSGPPTAGTMEKLTKNEVFGHRNDGGGQEQVVEASTEEPAYGIRGLGWKVDKTPDEQRAGYVTYIEEYKEVAVEVRARFYGIISIVRVFGILERDGGNEAGEMTMPVSGTARRSGQAHNRVYISHE